MSTEGTVFEIPMRQGRFVFKALLGLLWLGVATVLAWVVIVPTLRSANVTVVHLIFLLVGVAMATIGTSWLVDAMRQLRRPLPAFRLDADGIIDNQQRGGGRFIAWNDVDHFEAGWVGSTAVVYACPGKASAPDHALIPASAMDRRPFVVCARLGMDHEALRALLERHLALHRRRAGFSPARS